MSRIIINVRQISCSAQPVIVTFLFFYNT